MKAVIIGTLCGVSAAIAVLWFGQHSARPAAPKSAFQNRGSYLELSASTSPASALEAAPQLGRILPIVKCNKMPLEKLIAWIADTTKVNIYVGWHELAGGAGAGPDSPVTLDLRNVTAAAALQLALDQCRATGQRLGFVSIDGIVRVSIESELHRWELRIYDVRDLMQDAAELNRKIETAIQLCKIQLLPSRPVQQDRNQRTDPEQIAVAQLISVLMGAVPDDTWPFSGRISYFSGRLVVSQTRENQEKIAATLAALRAMPK
jgi:hypothetical protein